MNAHYNNDIKKKLCIEICVNGKSTLKTAQVYNIPIKTLEKWITAFNKDNSCFDPKFEIVNDFKLINNPTDTSYDVLSPEQLKKELMKKDIEIARLKINSLKKTIFQSLLIFYNYSFSVSVESGLINGNITTSLTLSLPVNN